VPSKETFETDDCFPPPLPEENSQKEGSFSFLLELLRVENPIEALSKWGMVVTDSLPEENFQKEDSFSFLSELLSVADPTDSFSQLGVVVTDSPPNEPFTSPFS
jgi:hypothetical protein